MARALALVAIPGTCHKWLTSTGCQDLANCKFKHPVELKGRTDLLPLCQEAASAGGICPRLATGQRCMYRHVGTALLGVPLPCTQVQKTVPPAATGTNLEIALMAMMLEQKDYVPRARAGAGSYTSRAAADE